MVYSAPITEVLKKLYENKLNDIVISYETAASLLGLVSEDGFPIEFYHTFRNINSSYVHGNKVEKVDVEDTIEVKGLLCTNKERTICEMIKNERDTQAIMESIYEYNRLHGVTKLYDYANKYGVYEELKNIEEDALNYYEGDE